jgi:hypothetical protein
MDEQVLNRRHILGGMAAAGATGLLGGVSASNAAAADTPDVGVASRNTGRASRPVVTRCWNR